MIQGLGQEKLDRSFSPSPKFIKMFKEKIFYSNLIHSDLCLMKRRLQFLNISYSLGDISFWARQIIVWSSVCQILLFWKFWLWRPRAAKPLSFQACSHDNFWSSTQYLSNELLLPVWNEGRGILSNCNLIITKKRQ